MYDMWDMYGMWDMYDMWYMYDMWDMYVGKEKFKYNIITVC